MSTPCLTPIPWEDLVAYFADDLGATEIDRIDEHLMACGTCSASSARVAAITEAVRGMIPAFLSRARLAAIRAQGLRIVENPVVSSERKTALFPLGVDVLLHRLAMDLARAESVEVTVSDEETGDVILVDPHVPFDPGSGEILVACQRHFGEMTRTIVFEVRTREGSGATEVSRFAIPHVFEGHSSE